MRHSLIHNPRGVEFDSFGVGKFTIIFYRRLTPTATHIDPLRGYAATSFEREICLLKLMALGVAALALG
jgi:hypothetical protein